MKGPARDAPKGRRKGRRTSLRVNARGWVYLLLTASVAIAAAIKGNNLLVALFGVLAGVFVVSGFMTVAVGRRMEISRLLPETVTVGEIFSIVARFRNLKGFWPAFCLKFQDRLTHNGRPVPLQPTPAWLPLARPGERVRGTYYATAQQRGWAKFGPFTLTSEFTPGLFTYRKILPAEDRILVFPRPGVLNREVLNPFLARVHADEFRPTAFTTGEEEFCGLRDYRDGDHPRRIDWKMSARLPHQDLLVREYEDARVRHAALLLETFCPPGNARRPQRLERAISFTAALAERLLAENHTVRFRAFGPDPVTIHLEPQRGAIDELLHTLALLKPSPIRTMGDLLADESGDGDEVFFLLRIGQDPLPEWEPIKRALVLESSDMRKLMSWEAEP